MFKRTLLITISIALSTNISAATIQKNQYELSLTQAASPFHDVVDATNTLFLASNKISMVEPNKQNTEPSQVPLPATLWLLAPVLIGLTQLRRQKKSNTP